MRVRFSYNLTPTMERSSYPFPWVAPKYKMEESEKEPYFTQRNCFKKHVFTKQDQLGTKKGAQLFIESLKIYNLVKTFLSQKFQD